MFDVRLTLSIHDLRRARACGLPARIADLRAVLPDVADGDPIDIRVWWSLPSTSTANAIWSLRVAQPPERAAAVAVLVARCAATRAGGYARDARDAYAASAAAYAASAAAYAAADAAADAAYAAAYAAAYDAALAAAAAADAADAYAAADAAAASDASDAAAAERAAQRADLLAALDVVP